MKLGRPFDRRMRPWWRRWIPRQHLFFVWTLPGRRLALLFDPDYLALGLVTGWPQSPAWTLSWGLVHLDWSVTE